jgi:hypothetical protein
MPVINRMELRSERNPCDHRRFLHRVHLAPVINRTKASAYEDCGDPDFDGGATESGRRQPVGESWPMWSAPSLNVFAFGG